MLCFPSYEILAGKVGKGNFRTAASWVAVVVKNIADTGSDGQLRERHHEGRTLVDRKFEESHRCLDDCSSKLRIREGYLRSVAPRSRLRSKESNPARQEDSLAFQRRIYRSRLHVFPVVARAIFGISFCRL